MCKAPNCQHTRLVYYPNPIFRQKCLPVEAVTTETLAILDDMLATVEAHSGLGMGAVQIGVLQRLVVVDIPATHPNGGQYCLINPEITWTSVEKATDQEGNLSMPGIYEEIERPARIRVNYIDRNGEAQSLEAEGLLARVIQHEIDHLNGVLFIDHLSKLKRDRAIKKFQKLQRVKG